MFLKSLIFAVAGALAFLLFKLAYRRKIAQLEVMEQEERERAELLLQEEWDRLERERQPML